MRREIGLIEYNTRFYSPTLGRFTQPDSIIPGLTNSQAWNRYSYVLNSPVMYVDPSGHCSGDPDGADSACWELIDEIEGTFTNVKIGTPDRWSQSELELIFVALNGNLAAFGNDKQAFENATGKIMFERETTWAGIENAPILRDHFDRETGSIVLTDNTFTDKNFALYQITHEIGHDIGLLDGLDNKHWKWNQFWGTSPTEEFTKEFWSGCIRILGICSDVEKMTDGASKYGSQDSAEDFGDSYASAVANIAGWDVPFDLMDNTSPSEDRIDWIENNVLSQ